MITKAPLRNEDEFLAFKRKIRHENVHERDCRVGDPPKSYPCMAVYYIQTRDQGDWLHLKYVYPEDIPSA